MKIVIIGAVAGGTSAAAKARRNDEIKIFDMDYDISYSGCGLPYYIREEIQDREDLTPRNAAQNILINQGFKKVYNISRGHKNYKAQSK